MFSSLARCGVVSGVAGALSIFLITRARLFETVLESPYARRIGILSGLSVNGYVRWGP